jgi:hypothetical protein
LKLAFAARRVFLVLGSEGGAARPLRVLLDGRPLARRRAGGDAHGSIVTVRGQRLYRLIDLPGVERHELELRPAPGISAYAFTFG